MGSLDNKQPSHVAILAFPFGTHAAPLYTLARHLAAAAPGAVFSFLGSAKSNAPLRRAPAPGNLRLYEVWDGAPDGFEPRNPQEEVSLFLEVTPGNFLGVMDRLEGGGKVTCILSDCFLWFAGKMADEMGVPWVTLWTGGTCSLSSHIYTDAIRSKIGVIDQGSIPTNRGDVLLDFVPGLSVMRARDLPEGIVFGDIKSPFSCLLHQMGKGLPSAVAVALNTFEGLEPDVLSDLSGKLRRCLPIGPLNLLTNPSPNDGANVIQDPSGCLPWLDLQPSASVAYIGFGTVLSLPPAELAALADALEESGVPFLWSLREHQQALLPPGFLARTRGRGMVVPWAPQMQALGHASVGVFLTHCGWNSVTESVIGGVPMMCRPFFGDQRMNARTVSDSWKIGKAVEDGCLTKEWVVTSLNTILRTGEGEKMRERMAPMKETAFKAVGKGGSSIRNFDILVELVCAT